jgi:hypothetical protein
MLPKSESQAALNDDRFGNEEDDQVEMLPYNR